jgi:hypothetical protein
MKVSKMNKVEIQDMVKTEPLELYVECPRERMDELLDTMRRFAKKPWMFWDTRFNASFSPPNPSFDFARFNIDESALLQAKSDTAVQYQGQLRWSKQPDMNVLLVWETGFGANTSTEDNDFLIKDFADLIATPACAELGLQLKMGPAAWRERFK